MKTSHIVIILAVLAVGAVVYMKFFHHKKPHVAAKGATPAVKKGGHGGWRHRFSHLASTAVKAAASAYGVPPSALSAVGI